MPFLTPFVGWEGSPTKIDYRKKGALILTSLLEGLACVFQGSQQCQPHLDASGLMSWVLVLGQNLQTGATPNMPDPCRSLITPLNNGGGVINMVQKGPLLKFPSWVARLGLRLDTFFWWCYMNTKRKTTISVGLGFLKEETPVEWAVFDFFLV